MISACWILATLAVPDSGSAARPGDVSVAALTALGHAHEGVLVAFEESRSAAGVEQRSARDSARVDSAWIARLRLRLATLAAGSCQDVRLSPGQSFPYHFVLSARSRNESSRVELDFRGACARLSAGGAEGATVRLPDDPGDMLALLAGALPRDRPLARFAGRIPHVPPDSATRAAAAPGDAPAAGTPSPLAAAGTPDSLPPDGQRVVVEQYPEPIERVAPEYPAAAQKRGIAGTVMVKALVTKQGTVARTVVSESIPELDEAAMASVRRWRFKPAMSKGSPVAVWVRIPVVFSLK